MTPMATSNSTNVNAREALIEFAPQRMSMAYHGVLIGAKHFFRILPAGTSCRIGVRRSQAISSCAST
jgi:hypothetical protein